MKVNFEKKKKLKKIYFSYLKTKNKKQKNIEEYSVFREMREVSKKYFATSNENKNCSLIQNTKQSGYYYYPKVKEFFQVNFYFIYFYFYLFLFLFFYLFLIFLFFILFFFKIKKKKS